MFSDETMRKMVEVESMEDVVAPEAPATPMDCLVRLQDVNDKLVDIIRERNYLLNQYQEMSHVQMEYADNMAKSFNDLLSQLSKDRG